MNAIIDVSGVVLETERLILREWKPTDLADFYEYASVKCVGEMAGWSAHKDIEESQEILKMFIEQKKTFALELKENHKVIGSLGIEMVSPCVDNLVQKKKGREIGYVLSKDYWGKGLMVEAVKKVIQYCFNELNYDFLCIAHFIDNHQSQRVIEKCGFDYLMNDIYSLANQTYKAKYYWMKRG